MASENKLPRYFVVHSYSYMYTDTSRRTNIIVIELLDGVESYEYTRVIWTVVMKKWKGFEPEIRAALKW